MGGVSNSSIMASESGTATFGGIVSLKNNGGFASNRASLNSPDTSGARGIKLRLKSDAKRYKLRLFNSLNFDNVAYEAPIVGAAGIWVEIELPFSSFKAVWRGKPVNNAQPFDQNLISALGFMISDQQVGAFALCLDWIRTY